MSGGGGSPGGLGEKGLMGKCLSYQVLRKPVGMKDILEVLEF